MARTSLSYLQDDNDPLNQLLGGGEPDVPDAQPNPAQTEQPPSAAPDEPQPQQYSASLRDPGDELHASLLSQPSPFASEAKPAAAAQTFASARESKDPELERAYRDAQLDALQHAKFDDSGYSVGKAVRDNGAALLASILDIGFNKGRGLGGIVGATAGEVGKQEDARQSQRKAAGDFALRARQALGGKGDELYRQGLLEVDRRNADLREREIALRENGGFGRGAKASDPKTAASGVAPPAPPAGDDYSQLLASTYDQTPPEPGSPERSEADINAPPRDTGAPPTPVSIPDTQPNGKPLTDAQLRARERDKLATSGFPGIDITDQNAWNAAVPDPTRRAAHEKYIGGATQALSQLDKMIELRKQVGPAWNGLDDERKRIAMDQMANAQKGVIGGLSTVGNTGVLNGSEFPRYAQDIPDGSFNKSDVYDQLAGAVMSPRDTQLEKLIGARRALADSINSGLKLAGARLSGPGVPSPAAAVPPPAASDGMQGMIDDGLGGRRGAPPIPANAPPPANPGDMVTVRFNGETAKESRDVAEEFARTHPGTEIL